MCNQKTLSLYGLVKELGIEKTQLFLGQAFSCSRNKDVESFLLNKAIRFETALAAATHLIINEQGNILAYFTLSFKEIEVEVSKSQLKKLTAGLSNDSHLRVLLIGQIGKNEKVIDNPVKLPDILNHIYAQLYKAQRVLGGRVVILECENTPKLLELYKQNKFQILNTIGSENGLKTLFFIPDF